MTAQPTEPFTDRRPRVSNLAAGTASVMLVLLALQQSLRLPAAWGVEDWLGWSDAASVVAAVEGWCRRPQGLVPAAAYFVIDQVLFVPLYAVLLLRLAASLRGALAAGLSRRGGRLQRLLGPGLWLMLGLLVLADTVENTVGLHNLGRPWWGSAGAIVGSLALGACLGRGVLPAPAWLRRSGPWVAGAALGVGLGLAAMASAACADPTDPVTAATGAHRLKQGLTLVVLLLPLVGAAAWWLGVEFDPSHQRRERDDRATLRALAAGVVGRSRYVLLILAAYGVLTLGMDQCRDVLLALADVPDLGPAFWTVRLPVLLAGPVAAALFAHSCWLWARLAGMVQRPGVALPEDAAVLHAVGLFACHWARALAVLPLLMLGVLVAFTLGDLALASESTPRALSSALLLLGFAVGALAVAALLLRARRRAQHDDMASYYNSEADLWSLLWFHSGHLPEPARRRAPQRVLALVTRPWLLPVLALLGMAALRVLMAELPDAMAPSPPTLVLLMLALTWWLGVLGLLSLWEQKHSLPWIGLPLLLVGGLSALGLNDNHALVWPGAIDVDALRAQGRAVTLLLVAFVLLGWWAAVADPGQWARSARLQRRWPVVAAGVVLTLAGLWHFDREAGRTPVPGSAGIPATAPDPAAPTLTDALQQWLQAAGQQGVAPGPLYLVAAEGGGIRSAYWTAQVLAALGADAGLPGFARRTLLLSGVSGGSMGIALHRACMRTTAGRVAEVARCIDQGFDRLDALSPLLGGLFFEDVLARLLPLSRRDAAWACSQPGCAHVDRAAGFEREWMRVFPPLAEPLQDAPVGRPGEPLLAFNSTWVETGNRTVAASRALAVDAFPAASQLGRCLGADSRLVTAAHTSARFPLTNPLAGVHALGEPDRSCRSGGHLIDGGYFDNSALPTVLDALRALGPGLQAAGWQPVVVMIRNGRRPRHCEPGPSGAPPPRCVLPQTGVLTDPQTLDQAGDRERLSLYADMLGPALALLNVSGVGAHGRDSSAALRTTLGELGRPCEASAIRLIDQVDDGALVPLGWYLSPAARQALRGQVALKVPGAC